jgi:ribosome-binding ATPase YchF (GTP1/OBG family)
MGLEIGMVGLPNVGKSSLFSGLAREDAEVASRLLTTTDPHVDVFFVRA